MRFWRTAAYTWTLLIAVLCWMPRAVVSRAGGESGFMIPNLDKVIHSGLFLVFAILWMKASPTPKRWIAVLAAGLVLAIVTEVGQTCPLVNRDCGLDDGLFDMLGVVVGVAIYSLFLNGTKNRSESVPSGAQAKGA